MTYGGGFYTTFHKENPMEGNAQVRDAIEDETIDQECEDLAYIAVIGSNLLHAMALEGKDMRGDASCAIAGTISEDDASVDYTIQIALKVYKKGTDND